MYESVEKQVRIEVSKPIDYVRTTDFNSYYGYYRRFLFIIVLTVTDG